MNILPHKSWHVYNKKNIEKVRKDEEKAKEEERAKQSRITLAESEARLNLLRKRADERALVAAGTTTATTESTVVKYEHVNLFEDLKGSTNEERDAEEKEKNDKWERQITMYLDKDKDDTPWYAGSKNSDERYRDTHVKKFQYKDNDYKKRRRDPIDIKDDPLALVNSLLKDKDKEKEKDKYKKRKSDNHHHRHQHSSRSDTKGHKSGSSSSSKNKEHKSSSKKASSSSSIEALRAQRLEREREERQRINKLMLGHDPNEEEEDQEPEGYHSQFNPNETRQAKEKRRKRY